MSARDAVRAVRKNFDAIRLVRGRFSGQPLPNLADAATARPSAEGVEPVEGFPDGDFWTPPPRAPLDYAEEPDHAPPAVKWLSLCETVLLISLAGGVAVALWVFFTAQGACG